MIDETTNMPALADGHFWRVITGYWNGTPTLLVRLMGYSEKRSHTSWGPFSFTSKPTIVETPLYQAPMRAPRAKGMEGHPVYWEYEGELEYTPENFRFIAQHVLEKKPHSMFGDHMHFGIPEGFENIPFVGDYPPKVMP